MAGCTKEQSEKYRQGIRRLLQDDPTISFAEIAAILGISRFTVGLIANRYFGISGRTKIKPKIWWTDKGRLRRHLHLRFRAMLNNAGIFKCSICQLYKKRNEFPKNKDRFYTGRRCHLCNRVSATAYYRSRVNG